MLSTILRRASLFAFPLLSIFAVACGASEGASSSSTETTSSAYASVAPATGQVSLPSPHADKAISGFVFTNDGASDVTISKIEVTLASGQVIKGEAGVGVQKGGSPITFLFDAKTTHEVSKLSFEVDGSTEKLVVTETDATGIVPTTAPGTSH